MLVYITLFSVFMLGYILLTSTIHPILMEIRNILEREQRRRVEKKNKLSFYFLTLRNFFPCCLNVKFHEA